MAERGPSALQYDNKLCSFLDDYDRAFIVHADNVGSKQFQEIRRVWSRVVTSSYSYMNGLHSLTDVLTVGSSPAQCCAHGQKYYDEALHPPIL